MTIAAQIGQVTASLEANARAADFIAVAKSLMAARGDPEIAADVAQRHGASKRAIGILTKTAVAGATLSDSTWAGSLADYNVVVQAFAESLRSAGAFDAILPFMRGVPLNGRIAVVTAGASAGLVNEAAPTPLTRLSTTAPRIEPVKVVAMLLASEDLLRLAAPVANELLARELRGAIATATDKAFLEIITTGTGVFGKSSSGMTAADVRADLRDLAAAVTTGAISPVPNCRKQ